MLTTNAILRHTPPCLRFANCVQPPHTLAQGDLKDPLMRLFFFLSPKLQKHDKEEEDAPALWRLEEDMAAEAAALRAYFQ